MPSYRRITETADEQLTGLGVGVQLLVLTRRDYSNLPPSPSPRPQTPISFCPYPSFPHTHTPIHRMSLPRPRKRPGRPRPLLTLCIVVATINVAAGGGMPKRLRSRIFRGFGAPPMYKPAPAPPADRDHMVGRTGKALGTRTSATGEKHVMQVRRVKGVKEQGEASRCPAHAF